MSISHRLIAGGFHNNTIISHIFLKPADKWSMCDIRVFACRAVHSPVNGTTAIPWRNSRRRLSLLEQLKGCQEAWCPRAPWDREGAHHAISGTPAGVSWPPRLTLAVHVALSRQDVSDVIYSFREFSEVNQLTELHIQSSINQ